MLGLHTILQDIKSNEIFQTQQDTVMNLVIIPLSLLLALIRKINERCLE